MKNYSSETLRTQLNETLGDEFVRSVSARYSGIYQWTINFELAEEGPAFDEARLQVKFGPVGMVRQRERPCVAPHGPTRDR